MGRQNRIVKTTFTYTFLHPEHIIPGGIDVAMALAEGGEGIGGETHSESVVLTNVKKIDEELDALGNDGQFFRDMGWLED